MLVLSLLTIIVSVASNHTRYNPMKSKPGEVYDGSNSSKFKESLSGAPKVMILPEYVEDYSGNSVTVDVVLINFNSDTTSIVAIEFYIDFDNAVASFTGADNFSALMPANQWFFSNPSPDLNRFACNWAEPALMNLSIPDSTVIMTLHFDLISNDTPLHFDQPASLFVHIDQSFNLIELDVEYFDGYFHVIPTGISDSANINNDFNWVYAAGNELIIQHVTGFVSVFNLSGQLVSAQQVSSNQHQIALMKTGLYIVIMMTDDERQLTRKILVNHL